jgi:uncharacterized protein (TIGR03083 family)
MKRRATPAREVEVATEVAQEWNATDPRAKSNVLRIVKQEAEGFFGLIDDPGRWESATASGWWQVRDIVGHIVDTTEGYLARFKATREGADPGILAGLPDMATTADSRAQAFRETPRDELIARLKDDYRQLMDVFENLTEDEWANLTILHGYMGPLPAFFYPVAQIMDYGVHSWDIRQGLGLPHYLPSDVGDILVPFMFIVWQATTDLEKLGSDPIDIGIRLSGRNAGTWRVKVDRQGFAYEAGEIDDAPATLEFDPSSMVLTAFGRTHAGTAYGDISVANRFSGCFFPI